MNIFLKTSQSLLLATLLTAAPTLGHAEEGEAKPAAKSGESAPAASEDKPAAKNAIFLELLGNGILYSLNYDRRLGESTSVRAGFMYLSLSAKDSNSSAKASILLIPLLFNGLFGSENHKFELGAGPLIVHASAESSSFGSSAAGSGTGLGLTGAIGYRYSPADGGFFFRVGLAPIITKADTIFWPGISFGGVF